MRKQKKTESLPEVMGEAVDYGCDGYYSDVQSPDRDRISEGFGKELFSYIFTLGIGFAVIIDLCAAILYAI